MSRRSVPLHSIPLHPIPLHLGLLLISLAIAWVTFRGELRGDAADEQQGVVLLQAVEGDVERTVYESERRRLLLEARRDDAGRWFLGEERAVEREDESAAGQEETAEESSAAEGSAEESAVSDDQGDAPTEAAAGDETTSEPPEIFRGGSAVESLWQRLEPLRARRVLGEVSADKLAELGLEETGERLMVTVRGREHAFSLGDEVFGSSDRYARQGDGRVMVLPGELVRELETGSLRLMERQLIEATRPEVQRLELFRGDRSVEIVQHGSSQPADAFWTLEGEEEPRTELATWADKLFRLQAVRYRTDDPAPDWRREARITVSSREHGSDTLEIFSAEEEGGRVWLGRSAFSRLVAELGSLAQEVCEDLDSLVP